MLVKGDGTVLLSAEEMTNIEKSYGAVSSMIYGNGRVVINDKFECDLALFDSILKGNVCGQSTKMSVCAPCAQTNGMIAEYVKNGSYYELHKYWKDGLCTESEFIEHMSELLQFSVGYGAKYYDIHRMLNTKLWAVIYRKLPYHKKLGLLMQDPLTFNEAFNIDECADIMIEKHLKEPSVLGDFNLAKHITNHIDQLSDKMLIKMIYHLSDVSHVFKNELALRKIYPPCGVIYNAMSKSWGNEKYVEEYKLTMGF